MSVNNRREKKNDRVIRSDDPRSREASTGSSTESSTESFQWEKCPHILCIRPDNMGDVLMTTPAFRALKESLPGRRLTLLTSSAGAAIARMIPEIDNVITFDVPWVSTQDVPNREAVVKLVELLRRRRFQAAVIFNVQSQNPLPAALLCYMAGIPNVLGYCRENPYYLMSPWVPDPEVLCATRHEVERQLTLVEAVGATTANRQLSLSVPPNAVIQALESLSATGVQPHQPWLVMHTGVSEEKRRYPAEEFIKAGRRLTSELGFQVVLTGSKSERAYTEDIRKQIGPGAVNLTGKLPLDVFCGLIAQAPVVVSNNTGPVHIASAVGTPVVVLYAMTNPQHTPWLVPNRVLYFDVPEPLRSRNMLLQRFPGPAEPKASVDGIVKAVEELTIGTIALSGT
ncbi:glycosyltransferase family 9 protein [Tellurirhabdus rosea]|uniref:glycosyltransferase family 9 protein n=1 Tax=Tellurirhabdus rosea TaxID=2674997 RepID=UPI0022585162|nr:glycosyltransferase family 9 protein [Tellurirhabdus rosea]